MDETPINNGQGQFNNGKINMYPQLGSQRPQLYNPYNWGLLPSSLNEINAMKDNYMAEICKRKTMSKTLSTYIPVFDYFDKTLLVLSAASGSVSIASFATVTAAPVGKANTSLSSVFFISNELLKREKETLKLFY